MRERYVADVPLDAAVISPVASEESLLLLWVVEKEWRRHAVGSNYPE